MSPFTKIAASGQPARANAKTHPAVIDSRTALMWTTAETDRLTHAEAQDHVDQLNASGFLGFTDWRLPTPQELFGLVDHRRYEPAIDTDAFPRCKRSWYWTGTPVAWSSVCAWVIDFADGYVGNGLRRDDDAFVRAVRRAAPVGP